MTNTQVAAARRQWAQAVRPSHVFVWQEFPGGKASFQNCLGAQLKLIQPGTAKAAVYQRPLLYQDTEGLMNQDDSGCRSRSNNGLRKGYLWQWVWVGKGSGVSHEGKRHCPLCVWWMTAGESNQITWE